MSTYSPDLRIELITTGDQAGTWGTTTNRNLGTIIEDAISGFATVSVTSANQAFTALDGLADEARNAMIRLTTTTTANFAVYAPPVSKQYIIWNNSAYTATIYNSTVIGNTTAAGTGVAVASGDRVVVFSDGTSFYSVKASSITGTLGIANGGTGQTTQQTAINALAGATTSGQYLRGDGTNVLMSAIQGGDLPLASSTTRGSVKLVSNDVYTGAIEAPTTTANRTYGLQVDSIGVGVINVPWTDTTYSTATTTVNGLIKLGSNTAQATAANAVTATASRTYALQLNASGQGVINVPWTDTTYATATETVNGLIKLGSNTAQSTAANSVTATASRTYALQLNASGQGVVNVPWTDTTYSTATSSANGLIRLGSDTAQTTAANAVTSTASRTYAIQLNASGQAVVNVPWTTTPTPAGSTTQVQYNNAGALAGSANFTFDGTNVAMANDASISGLAVGKGGGAVNGNTVVGNGALTSNTTNTGYTTVGYQAGSNVTSGGYSTFAGYRAGYYGNGDTNVAIGYTALYGSSIGAASSNARAVAVGGGALYSAETTTDNVAVGYRSAYSTLTGVENVSLGNYALYSAAAASYGTAVGFNSMYYMAGSNNTALGHGSLQGSTTVANNTGTNNSAVGYQALYSLSSGANNSAHGYQALYSMTTAGSSTAMGYRAGYYMRGGYNVAIGYQAMLGSTTPANNTGEYNVAVGYTSLPVLTSGYHNTAVGLSSGENITTGFGNVCIGKQTVPSAASGQFQIVIGYNLTGRADNNVTIGTGAGQIYNAFTLNATWTQTSDASLKNVIGQDTLGLSFINRLKPVKFTWKPSNELPKDSPYYRETNERNTSTVIHGFVAQDVKAALDAEGCNTFNGWDQGADGIQAISREMFVSPLVNAVNELTALVQKLNARIEALEAK